MAGANLNSINHEHQTDFHNVILFGAGASADAGIPLLGTFVDKMWEYAIRRKAGNNSIDPSDVRILTRANEIRIELDAYSSRANFDSRNLEDILSLLSFEALAAPEQTEKYKAVVRAVARTIELSCNIPHFRDTPVTPPPQAAAYQQFWQSLLGKHYQGNRPAIITFNYDLVLERTLWHAFHQSNDHWPESAASSCSLEYRFESNRFAVRRVPHEYRGGNGVVRGVKAEYMGREIAEATIPYLKLHGSLNWSQTDPGNRLSAPPTGTVDTPVILPPVFNKMNTTELNSIWNEALLTLRKAKHIIIVGYSLPQTDIYMQYFLKSAVGPNTDLQKIIVFNPTLFQESEEAEKMKTRYRECFAPQFAGRIDFRPTVPSFTTPNRGTFSHFFHCIHPSNGFFFQP